MYIHDHMCIYIYIYACSYCKLSLSVAVPTLCRRKV